MEAPNQTVATQKSALVSPNEQLLARKLYQHDPLFVLLEDVWHLNPLIIVVATIFISLLVIFVPPLIWNFSLKTSVIVSDLLQTLLAFPLLALQCLRLPDEIADLFSGLKKHNVVGLCREEQGKIKNYADFLQLLAPRIDNLWWTIGAFALVIGYASYRLFLVEPTLPLLHPPVVSSKETLHALQQFWYRMGFLAIYSVMLYSAFIAIARLLVALYYTNKLFHTFKINVNPLHPDGSGGLAIIEQMLGVSTGIITNMGVIALLVNASFLSFLTTQATFFSIVEAVVVGILYLLLAPTFLFGWLFAPHQVMQDARDAALQPLADQFQETIGNTTPSSETDANEIKRGTDRMAELKRRYDLLQETFPIWPAQIQVIKRLIAAVSLPALITFISWMGPVIAQTSGYISTAISGK